MNFWKVVIDNQTVKKDLLSSRNLLRLRKVYCSYYIQPWIIYDTFRKVKIITEFFDQEDTKNMAPVSWEIICKRNLPRYVLLIWEGDTRGSMEASDMTKRNGWWWKMIRKMFTKHHWASSFVYTWKDIDLFVAFWIIIRHLCRCGIREASVVQ